MQIKIKLEKEIEIKLSREAGQKRLTEVHMKQLHVNYLFFIC